MTKPLFPPMGISPTRTAAIGPRWALLGGLSLALLAMAALILLCMPDASGLRQLIRATARSSLLLFVLAFTASAQAQLWPGAWSLWLCRQRRQLGLAMAVSHAIHACAIAGFALLDPLAFQVHLVQSNPVPGYIGYAFIAAMAATSFDRSAAWLGPRAWRWLHVGGVYFLWVSFMVTFGKRLPQSGAYALPVLVLLVALALRLWPLLVRRPAV
ncbi:protein-methionine-sulfoxide reductase heme-binding subunit MsrQ [Comamonadaceae bacterium OS-1]|nr:protein-methionine-sulfoxide reductase heme-binding subunit MsrQ [Comamonadaceae bacterium OS-1]